MKTVNDFILELQALKPSLRDKPVVVNAPNGLQFEPKLLWLSGLIPLLKRNPAILILFAVVQFIFFLF